MWNRHTAPVLDFSIDAEQPQWSQITQARADVSARYTQMQIDHFFDMLTDLPSYLVRISEQVKLEEESLRVTTKLTYQYSPQRVPPDKKDQLETLLIPLFTTKKETLIDDLSVIDGSGDQVTTLSQYDMRGLLAITLETFFQLAKKKVPTQRVKNQQGRNLPRSQKSPKIRSAIDRNATALHRSPPKRRPPTD